MWMILPSTSTLMVVVYVRAGSVPAAIALSNRGDLTMSMIGLLGWLAADAATTGLALYLLSRWSVRSASQDARAAGAATVKERLDLVLPQLKRRSWLPLPPKYSSPAGTVRGSWPPISRSAKRKIASR